MKSDSPASSKGFLSVLRMDSGTSHPHCKRCLDATVRRTLLFLLLSYSLDQPTNYRHFFSAGCFYRWREEGSLGKGEEMGVSATGCLLLCAVLLMINLSSFIRTCPLLPVYCR